MKTSTKDMERITGMSEKFNTDNTFREFITTGKIAYNRGRGQRYRKYTTQSLEFGLASAPSTFTKLMHQLTRGLDDVMTSP